MNRVGRILLWVLFGVLFIVVIGFITQQLWNWLVPTLFNGPVIGFWQALGLLLLSKILFSGFGKKCHGGHGRPPYWKSRLHEKFAGMTAEEREAFKQKMRDKWCVSPEKKEESTDTND